MWKIWHKIFGAHYVAVEFGYSHHIRRVQFTGSNRPFVNLYGEFVYLDDRTEKWEGMTFNKTEWLKSREKPQLRVVR